MIENILKLCREQPNDGLRGEDAAAAAIKKLAEIWTEQLVGMPKVQQKKSISHDFSVLRSRLATLQNNIDAMLDLQSSLRHTGLTVRLEGGPTSNVESWDDLVSRIRDEMADVETIADIWNVNDVLHAAERMKVEIDRATAWKVLQYVMKHFRAQDGVNWTVIEKAIEKVLEGDDDD